MAYKVIISSRAQKEIENAIDYYSSHSTNAPVKFISVLKEAYSTLETNPFFMIIYKNVRALRIKKFPYSLYFIINDNNKTVRILSCFHNKRDPDKRP